jgi:type II secretory pathway pseudopilin PulG
MAHSAIKKSNGTLRGEGMATTGLITGYLSIALVPIVGILAAIAVPNFVKARGKAQLQVAETDCRSIQLAVETYYTEYGRLPGDLASEGSDATLGADNARLMNVLRAQAGAGNEEHKWNPRKVVFFEGRPRTGDSPRGVAADGTIYDPWGAPYQIIVDTNGDGKIENPYLTNAGPSPIQGKVFVYSLGPDGSLGTDDNRDASADATSAPRTSTK